MHIPTHRKGSKMKNGELQKFLMLLVVSQDLISQMEIPKKFVESRTTNTIGKLLHGHHVAHHMPFRQEKSHVLELIRI